MTFLDTVKKRYSCRKYSPKPVPEDKIERCLEAARLAPSACNSQPWHFIVVQDNKLKNNIADKAFSGIYKINQFAKEAPILVLAIREKSEIAVQLGETFRGIQYSLIDLGIACEHFVIQASEEGLGTCWIGWFNEKAVKKALNMPNNQKIDIIISLGYAQEDIEDKIKSRKSLQEISEIK